MARCRSDRNAQRLDDHLCRKSGAAVLDTRQRLRFRVLCNGYARRITVAGGIALADRFDATRGCDGRFAIAVSLAVVRAVRDRFGVTGAVAVAVAYAGGIAITSTVGEPVDRAVAFTRAVAVAVAPAGALSITVAKSVAVAGPLAVPVARAGTLTITIAPGRVAIAGSLTLTVAGDADRPRHLRQRRPMGTDSRCERVLVPGSEWIQRRG